MSYCTYLTVCVESFEYTESQGRHLRELEAVAPPPLPPRLGTSHFLGRRDMQAVSSILQSSDVVNNLGVYLDSGLVMDRQVSKLCQVCYSPASVANSASIAHQGIATHISPRLRCESVQSLQRSPVRVSFLSSRQASVRVELGRSAGPEHPQVQPHISCHPRRAPLASSQEGSTSRSPLWSVTAWLVLRRSTWWNCAILLAQPSVDNVFGRLLVVTSLFRGVGFKHSAIGPSLSRAPKFGTLFRSRSDIRVTIYCFSNRNWKRICFSSSERFCGSISNEGPCKFSILLLLLQG